MQKQPATTRAQAVCTTTTKSIQSSAQSKDLNHSTKNHFFTMKKNLLITALLFVTFSATAQQAQKNALKINPLSLLVKTGNISYERALSNNHSFQIGGFYSGAGIGDFNYQGYGALPEFRFYFGGQAQPLNGAYVAPFGRFQNFSITNRELKIKARFSTIGGGVVAGYQKRWEGGFILTAFAGPSFNTLTFENDNQEDDFDLQTGLKGFGLRTGITIGFSF